jgi:ERCC4-type nuclease
MAESYDYAYLVIEGSWIAANTHIEVGNWGRWVPTGFSSHALYSYLMGLSLRTGIIIWRTQSPEETTAFAVSQYRMWRESKDLFDHEAHRHVKVNMPKGKRFVLVNSPPTACELHCLQIPGLDKQARQVSAYFKTVERMVSASQEEWANIRIKVKGGKTRKLGESLARKAWAHLRQEH